MLLSLIAFSVVFAGWALGARRLEKARLTAPMILVLAGMAVGFTTSDALADSLNTDIAQHGAEIVLAILLFVDATAIRGGLFGRDPGSAMRILFIALPLSMALSVALGLWLLPGLSWAVLLIIACVVVPTDFAPAASILRDDRIPEKVRNLLNVEAGYNDGIISPVFIFALALAGGRSHERPLEALGSAVPQALGAILVGVAVGAVLASLVNLADRRGAMTTQSRRMILVTAPVLAYGLSVAVHGNGFVSAFVCGIAFHYLRRTPALHAELELLDDVGFLLSAVMWFVFGAVAVLALSAGVSWSTVLFCVLALTVVRVVPVLIAMLGSRRFARRERMFLGWLGPRGTASIVFGLLAFNVLVGEEEHAVVIIMVVAVLGSVLLHGLGAPAAAARLSQARN